MGLLKNKREKKEEKTGHCLSNKLQANVSMPSQRTRATTKK